MPIECRVLSLEEQDRLGIPRTTSVISSVSDKKTGASQESKAPTSPSGSKTPKPEPQS